MVKAGRRRTLALTVVCGSAVAIATGTASAGANSLRLSIPHVTVKKPYTITVRGSTAGSTNLYMFIDYKRCGANPRVELSRKWKFGSSSGRYLATVSGSFTESLSFRTTAAITDHACIYLTKPSAAKYSRKGVVAHAFASYRVHKTHKKHKKHKS